MFPFPWDFCRSILSLCQVPNNQHCQPSSLVLRATYTEARIRVTNKSRPLSCCNLLQGVTNQLEMLTAIIVVPIMVTMPHVVGGGRERGRDSQECAFDAAPCVVTHTKRWPNFLVDQLPRDQRPSIRSRRSSNLPPEYVCVPLGRFPGEQIFAGATMVNTLCPSCIASQQCQWDSSVEHRKVHMTRPWVHVQCGSSWVLGSCAAELGLGVYPRKKKQKSNTKPREPHEDKRWNAMAGKQSTRRVLSETRVCKFGVWRGKF